MLSWKTTLSFLRCFKRTTILRLKVKQLPSWKLTYPIPRHFWRWFSFHQGGICIRSLEGKQLSMRFPEIVWSISTWTTANDVWFFAWFEGLPSSCLPLVPTSLWKMVGGVRFGWERETSHGWIHHMWIKTTDFWGTKQQFGTKLLVKLFGLSQLHMFQGD